MTLYEVVFIETRLEVVDCTDTEGLSGDLPCVSL